MFFLTILKKDARQIGFLVAESPFRDTKEQDEYIDIRLDPPTEDDAVREALAFVKRHQLEYWEIFRVVPVKSCPLVDGPC